MYFLIPECHYLIVLVFRFISPLARTDNIKISPLARTDNIKTAPVLYVRAKSIVSDCGTPSYSKLARMKNRLNFHIAISIGYVEFQAIFVRANSE